MFRLLRISASKDVCISLDTNHTNWKVLNIVVCAMYNISYDFPSNSYLQKTKLQSNGYDCGVWILAQILATLRGFDVVNVRERDISRFRAFLFTQCNALPLHNVSWMYLNKPSYDLIKLSIMISSKLRCWNIWSNMESQYCTLAASFFPLNCIISSPFRQ